MKTENRPPVADAGPDQTIEATSPSGTPVVLDGSASSDPDNNMLAYEWRDGDGNVVGNTAQINLSLALGTHTFTLNVSDGQGGTAGDSVSVILQDTNAPTIQCAQADGQWHASDVAIPCTATDGGSGLANSDDAGFALHTQVPAGTETANASTDSRQVCDAANNCATAGPVGGNMVDKKAPEITIVSPAGNYVLNQTVTANYSCADGGAGVANCTGTIANGGTVNTSVAGSYVFSVTATDQAGNAASKFVNYSVGYNVCVLYDETKAHKSGSTIPVKLQLCDANGANLSSSSINVHALAVSLLSNYAPGEVEDAGHANPDDNFRFNGDRYLFNLKTNGLQTGTYVLIFRVGADPLTHTVQFQIK